MFLPVQRRVVSKLLLLIIFILLPAVCTAQKKIEISGKVTDHTTAILPRVNILLVSGKDTLIRHTDEDGLFSFVLPSPSKVQLISSHIGYGTDQQSFDVSADIFVHVTLFSTDIQLDETVITARSKTLVNSSDQGIIRINSQKLSQIPSVMGVPDMIKVLQLMPGVQNSGESNGYLYVRGTDPGHNLMLYNDVPVYGMSHLLGIFPFYNTDHIDRIYFDKSGKEAMFGNRLGATVQAISPDQLPGRFSVKGNIGLVASQLTLDSPLGKKSALIFSGRQTYVDQIIKPILNSSLSGDKAMDDLGYSFTDANLTYLYRPGKNHQIDINAFLSGDRFKITEERMLLDGKLKWSNSIASADWRWQVKPDIQLKQSFYISFYNNHLQIEQASINLTVKSNVLDWGYNSSIGFVLKEIPFTAGIQYASYKVRPQEFKSHQLTNITEADNIIHAHHFSSYLQAKPGLGSFLYLDIGIRANLYASTGDNRKTDFRIEPRISLNYSDDHKFNAYLAYARKSQYLHLITTSSVGFPTDFWIATSKGIPSEIADNFSIGSNYKLHPRIEITAGLFFNRLNHLVQYPYSILQFNEITSFGDDLLVGKGKSYGAELMLKKTGRLSGWISYTWSKSERQFNEIDRGQTFLSKFDRRHNLSAVVSYEVSKRWNVGLTQVFTSGNRFTAPVSWYFINNNPVKEYGRYNNAQMPDYVRTDIAVDFYIKKTRQRESILNLSVYNLFAVKNPIYVILDISASDTGNEIKVHPRYKTLYSILPSIGWRFKF
ncbi:MAG: TonB-dependent receptor [Bacteroidales bacterium]|jgi:hypothetical protein|nr:TonB-dependent receptor [Bacteroidales bacterium]